MTHKKQKLELTWIGKDKRPKLEARILLEDASLSYHATHRVNDGDIFDNRLIFGDNLLALKALEQEFAGRIKCVFIDPPYNTGSAFTHYDDGLEHSIWLGLMRDRLEIIKRLLADDGSLWITIDDNECHYLKVLCDEIFGRGNFVANVVWQKFHSVKTNAQYRLSAAHDHVLIYKKGDGLQDFHFLDMDDDALKVYKNPDSDPRGVWRTAPLTVSLLGGARGEAYAKTGKSTGLYEIVAPNGKVHLPSKGRCWISRNGFDELVKDNKIWWGKDGNAVPMRKLFLSESGGKKICSTFWTHTEVGSNKTANEEQRELFGDGVVFSTPKPERLLQRIIHLATNTGDLILDSFAGSGTTGAVAHKMGRRWIMVELGEHCHTHIIPRMQKVIDGTDQGGISKAVNWQGGGGFRYYHLAPTLIVKDAWDNDIINPEYNGAMLAEALCKLEAFTYAPSEVCWWMHGYSTENDFIYVTTQTLTVAQLQALSDEVGANRSLLVCCSAYRGVTAGEAHVRFPNLSLKKIPKMVLARCEWGHDDYSLNVANLPLAQAAEKTEPAPSAVSVHNTTRKTPRGKVVRDDVPLLDGLFGDLE